MILRKWDIQFCFNPWLTLGFHFDHTDPSITLHLPGVIVIAGRCKQPGFRPLIKRDVLLHDNRINVTLILPLSMPLEIFRQMVSYAFEVSCFSMPWKGGEDLKVGDWDFVVSDVAGEEKHKLELKKRKECT